MSKFFTYLVTLLFLFGLNAVMPKIFGVRPNFLFLLVIFYALRKNNLDFLWLAFFAGLFADIYSGIFFGSYTIGFLIIAFVLNYAIGTFFTADLSVEFTSVAIIIAYIILVGIIYLINSFAFRLGLATAALSPEYIVSKIWLDILLNIIFAAPIYYLTTLNDKIILKFERSNRVL